MDIKTNEKKRSFQKYSDDFKKRVVEAYRDRVLKSSTTYGIKAQIAKEHGINDVTLSDWIKRSDAQNGTRNGLTEAEKDSIILELKKKNDNLERDNAILKEAAAFFARELDPRN